MLQRLVRSWLLQERLKQVIVPEAAAIALAQRKGFSVMALQVRRKLKLRIDKEPRRIDIPAHLLLNRDGKRYVGMIGAKDETLDPANPGTQLKLFQFRSAYRVHGVVLLDVEGKKIVLVEFTPPRQIPIWLWMSLGALVGAFIEASVGPASVLLWFIRRYFL